MAGHLGSLLLYWAHVGKCVKVKASIDSDSDYMWDVPSMTCRHHWPGIRPEKAVSNIEVSE